MQLSISLLVLLVSSIHAQSLSAVLQASDDLSDFKKVLGRFPAVVKFLSETKDITILAPENGATGLSQLVSSTGSRATRQDYGRVEATLAYHVLKKTYPSAVLGVKAFPESLLDFGNYSAVTGGQRVEIIRDGRRIYLPSGGYRIRVKKPDVRFDGGVIHFIDGVLTPPQSLTRVASDNNLRQLGRQLEATKLTPTIEAAKDITIFAPRDAAFISIQSALGRLSADQISSVLKYHVVPGVIHSTGFKDVLSLPTQHGKNLAVLVSNSGQATVNGAEVVKADILIKNGVMHIVDKVFNPGF